MVSVDPYELLGVQRTATTAEITLAYQRLSAVFDPARWVASPSLVREATAWTAAIDQARRTILGR
jgi:curved DNA-binding protein CbpA